MAPAAPSQSSAAGLAGPSTGPSSGPTNGSPTGPTLSLGKPLVPWTHWPAFPPPVPSPKL